MELEKALKIKVGDKIKLKSTINTFIDNRYDDDFIGKEFVVEELDKDMDDNLIFWLDGIPIAFNFIDIKD